MAAGGKKGGRILIFVALLIILALAAVYFLYIRPMQQQPATVDTGTPSEPVVSQEMVDIVITTQAIPRGTVLTADVLTTIPYPRQELVEGTFYTSIEEVINLRAKYDLEARMPLTPTLVINAPEGSLASFSIPGGMTAYSIPIDSMSAVSFAPQAGDHVMVIGCMLLVDLDQAFQTVLPNSTAAVTRPGPSADGGASTAALSIVSGGAGAVQGRTETDPVLGEAVYVQPAEDQRPRLVCQTVIADAVVLKVGEFDPNAPTVTQGQTTDAAAAEGENTETPAPEQMTIIVTPQDSVLLNYLTLSGAELSLALRGAGDTQPISTSSVTLQFVMDQKNIQLPAKLPYGMEPALTDLGTAPQAVPVQ